MSSGRVFQSLGPATANGRYVSLYNNYKSLSDTKKTFEKYSSSVIVTEDDDDEDELHADDMSDDDQPPADSGSTTSSAGKTIKPFLSR